jgi:ABC-type glycerol-3-phosphate transport system permease component
MAVIDAPMALDTTWSPAVARRATRRSVVGTVGVAVAYVVVTFVFALPLVWLILTSFKPTPDVFRYTAPLSWYTFFPPVPTLFNYWSIFATWHFERDLLNTAIATVGQVVGACVTCSLAAFVFARTRFRGRDTLFALSMLTAFVPFDVVVVPLYSVVRSLDLVSTYAALFLPFVASPFGVFLMRQAFLEIPRDLDEAATVEGASLFQIFRHVVLPNGRPALVTLALVQFMWAWNSFLWPLVVMQDRTKQVVQVTISTFRTAANYPLYGELFAASTAATVPILILFFLLQRYYVRGMLMSGMK